MLEVIKHGKPHRPTYNAAVQKLNAQVPTAGTLQTVYAVGDNPQSDIRGARSMGESWVSLLVRTGCFHGEDNDAQDPADFVVENISAALDKILQLENFTG